ncbi:MAG: hypothetical protein M3373_04160 [Gemmatimonadota bacterium]|nr:hypothetical protein [Gemmatimonadota bacterium]
MHRGSGLAEERRVDQLLIRPRDGAKLRGEREGEEVVVARKESAASALEPGLRPLGLTFGTVPVAAGVIAVVERVAVVTLIE